MSLDKFKGFYTPKIIGSTWGQGEYGYTLSIFDSHYKDEVEKAKTHFENIYIQGRIDMQNEIIDKLGSYETNRCAQIAASIPVDPKDAG